MGIGLTAVRHSLVVALLAGKDLCSLLAVQHPSCWAVVLNMDHLEVADGCSSAGHRALLTSHRCYHIDCIRPVHLVIHSHHARHHCGRRYHPPSPTVVGLEIGKLFRVDRVRASSLSETEHLASCPKHEAPLLQEVLTSI